MTSKAERLRKKRIVQGRPRRQGVERHDNGKINYTALRPETEKEIKAVAIEARKRVHGMDTEAAASPFAGYTLGRLFLDGRIYADQRKAGDEYAMAMARYYGLLGIHPSVRAQEIFRAGGLEGGVKYSPEVTDDYQRAMGRSANTMMYYEGLLLACQDGPQVKQTVYNLCIMDYAAMRFMPDRQLRWLTRGLDKIVSTWT